MPPISAGPFPTRDQPFALHGAGLRHAYGGMAVLRGVDLAVARGECVALHGPNGAGKTTLVRILATLVRPSAGTLTIGGIDALRDQTHARSLLGMAGDRTLLSPDLTARENLRFYARLYGLSRIDWAIDAALSQLDVRNLADRHVRTLSHGMQQRVSLARAILHDPLVLLLDEPETALDQGAQQRLAAVFAERGSRGCATLVVSHRPDWTQTIANRSLLLQDGLIASMGGGANRTPEAGGAAGVGADRTPEADGTAVSPARGRLSSTLDPASEGAAQQ